MALFSACRRLLEYGTLQHHIDEILSQYDEEPKPGKSFSEQTQDTAKHVDHKGAEDCSRILTQDLIRSSCWNPIGSYRILFKTFKIQQTLKDHIGSCGGTCEILQDPGLDPLGSDKILKMLIMIKITTIKDPARSYIIL